MANLKFILVTHTLKNDLFMPHKFDLMKAQRTVKVLKRCFNLSSFFLTMPLAGALLKSIFENIYKVKDF